MTNAELERARRSAPIEDLSLERLHERRDRKEGRRRIGALITALVIAAGVIFGLATLRTGDRVVAGGGGDHNGGSVDPRRAAAAVLSVPDGSYVYTRTTFPSNVGTQSFGTVETWWATDDSGRINNVSGYHAGQADSYGPGEFPNDTGDLSGLSTDPSVLARQMIDRTGPNGASPEPYNEFTPGPGQDGHLTAGLVRSIGELLRDPNASPELRAALFTVLAEQPGMAVVENTTDPAGRPATELWIETENEIHHLWFDANSHQLMATEDTDLQGTSYGRTIVEASGIVGSDHSTDLSDPFFPSASATP
jgi:hypothetical protein